MTRVEKFLALGPRVHPVQLVFGRTVGLARKLGMEEDGRHFVPALLVARVEELNGVAKDR